MARVIIPLTLVLCSLTAALWLNIEAWRVSEGMSALEHLVLRPEGGFVDSVRHLSAGIAGTDKVKEDFGAWLAERIFDAVVILDDYGIDKKTAKRDGDIHTITLFSAKDNGYQISVTFELSTECAKILGVEGVAQVLTSPCHMRGDSRDDN